MAMSSLICRYLEEFYTCNQYIKDILHERFVLSISSAKTIEKTVHSLN